MKVGICNYAEGAQEALCRLKRALAEGGAECVCFGASDKLCGVDRLIVLGGDGAVLHAARQVLPEEIPLVGINYGHLGFLTEFERGEEEAAVRLVLRSSPSLIRRSVIEAEYRGRRMTCLNEVSLLRKISPEQREGVVRFSVEVNGDPAGEFTADGLILSTPTGSTAYSLSAGGCILTPACEAFLLTPVNALSLRSRPILFPDRSEFCFSFPEDCAIVVHGDGVFLGECGRGEELIVRKSARSSVFITKDNHDFFRRLTEKIK